MGIPVTCAYRIQGWDCYGYYSRPFSSMQTNYARIVSEHIAYCSEKSTEAWHCQGSPRHSPLYQPCNHDHPFINTTDNASTTTPALIHALPSVV